MNRRNITTHVLTLSSFLLLGALLGAHKAQASCLSNDPTVQEVLNLRSLKTCDSYDLEWVQSILHNSIPGVLGDADRDPEPITIDLSAAIAAKKAQVKQAVTAIQERDCVRPKRDHTTTSAASENRAGGLVSC